MSKPNISSDPAITSDAQIIEILRDHAGLNPEEGTDRAELIALARKNGIKVDAKEPKPIDEAKATAKGGKKIVGYRISIASEKDKPHVIIGLNGTNTQIKCDTEVVVKPGVYEILCNARKDVFDDIRDDIGRVIERIKRTVPVHAVNVHETIYG